MTIFNELYYFGCVIYNEHNQVQNMSVTNKHMVKVKSDKEKEEFEGKT